MTRKLPLLALVLALLLPAGASAQDRSANGRSSDRSSSAAVEEELFRRVLAEIAERHIDVHSDSALWSMALQGLIEGLDDPYASVLTPDQVEEFDEGNTGNYTGIGVQITELSGRVTVTKVFRGTPADQVGMVEGDVIVGVAHHDASEWTTDIIADSIRGPAGTDIRVVVERKSFGGDVPFVITRAEVHVPAVEADLMAGDIGYIRLDRVAQNSAVEVDSVLRELPAARGLVIDLRRNPGGFLDESLYLSDVFLEPGERLASLKERGPLDAGSVGERSWDARIPARVPDKPIVILVDEFTASAAEIVAGALQDHDRALIMGERTFGKGVVQTVLDLPYGHKLRLTTGTWHTPLGRSLHRARDSEGRPIEEDLDTLPTLLTPSGRSLYASGGIFPDLRVAPDTLVEAERQLLLKAAEAEVPLGIRIQEFGFDEAQRIRESGRMPDGAPDVRDRAFDEFVASLVEAGVPAELIADPVAREYLRWRTRVALADRLLDIGNAAEVRMERDAALAEAVRLLKAASTQPQLFNLAKQAEDRPEQQQARRQGG